MSKIGISINEVLRDFLGQFNYTYDKYIAESKVKEGDVKSFDLLQHYKFEDINKLNSFLYLEAPLEIFGHADQLKDGLFNRLNEFIMDIEDDEEHQIEIVSREVNKSIPSTLFFLSKVGARPTSLRFVKRNEDEWGDLDVLITANPIALESKPNGKISVKVKASYNEDVKADYEIESILDFIQNHDLRTKILSKTITTTYEEIN